MITILYTCITRKGIHHKKDVKIITYRNVKNLNVNLFMSDMLNAPWQTINQLSSPNVALVVWSNIFQGIIDKRLPVITKKVKHSNPASWMNEEIRYAMHTRDFLKRVNCHDQYTLYRVWRNKVVKLVKQAKQKFYVHVIETNKSNPTVLWKHLKNLCPDKEDKSLKVLKLDDQIVTEPASIVDRLTCYFTSVTERYLPNPIQELDQDSVNTICSFVITAKYLNMLNFPFRQYQPTLF